MRAWTTLPPKCPAKALASKSGSHCATQSAIGPLPLARSGETSTTTPDARLAAQAGPVASAAAPAKNTRFEITADIAASLAQTPPNLPSDIGHVDDFVRLAAARRVDLDHVADRLADHRAGGRRGDRDLARLHVGLGVADDL